MSYDKIKVIAFDADDTLWNNEPYFRNAEHTLCRMLAPYGTEEELSERIFGVEMANMPDYGYGAIAFTMSLIESAIKISEGKVTAAEIGEIIEMGRQLLRLDAKPLDGVAETLKALKDTGRYRLVVFTKGELLTQGNKLKRSGLQPYFDKVFIVTDKTEEQYRDLCREMGIVPEELLMVGNSLKSDILPALNIGASTIYIPYEIMWQHEVIDHFEHERMRQVGNIRELVEMLG